MRSYSCRRQVVRAVLCSIEENRSDLRAGQTCLILIKYILTHNFSVFVLFLQLSVSGIARWTLASAIVTGAGWLSAQFWYCHGLCRWVATRVPFTRCSKDHWYSLGCCLQNCLRDQARWHALPTTALVSRDCIMSRKCLLCVCVCIRACVVSQDSVCIKWIIVITSVSHYLSR